MIVSSVGKDGTKFILSLTKKGQAEGEIRVMSWKPGNNSKRPNTDDRTPLYNIRRKGNKVTCLARVFGPDPVVTFEISAKAIKVNIAGALASNGTTVYPLDADEVEEILAFLDEAQFPNK